MKKIIKIDITQVKDAGNRQIYVYRIASFSIDKISLEKHSVSIMNSFEANELVAELNEDTKVGVVTQKVSLELIPVIMQAVDEVVSGFESSEKMITKINFSGIKQVVQ